MPNWETEYFECDCGCYMHNIRLAWFQDEWMKEHNVDRELYIDIGLRHYLSFWKRLKVAFMYLFKKEKCGSYDCVVLDNKEAVRLKDYLSNLIGE